MSAALTNRRASFGLIAGCVIFGMGSLIVKFVPVGAFAIAFWRLFVSGIIFWFLARFFKQRYPSSARAIRYAIISGTFLGMDLALWHESIYAVGPGLSTLLNSLQIFFLSAIGVAFYHERLGALQILSLLMAIAGVALIASPEMHLNNNATWGLISGIISGAMLALSMVFVRKTNEVEKVSLFPMMLLVSIGGVLILILILPSIIFDWGHILPPTASDWGWIFIYGAVMQCLAWGLIAYSIPLLSLSLTGLLLLSEPVAALLIDYFLLDKTITAMQWLGVGLTLIAIYFGSLGNKSSHTN